MSGSNVISIAVVCGVAMAIGCLNWVLSGLNVSSSCVVLVLFQSRNFAYAVFSRSRS